MVANSSNIDFRLLKSFKSQKDNGVSLFAESQASIYTGYQQAWRYLGFFVDCKPATVDSSASCTRYLLWAAYVDLDYEGGGISEYSFYDPIQKKFDSSNTCMKQKTAKRCARMDCHENPDATHWKLLGVFKHQYYASEWLTQLVKHEGSCVWNNYTTTQFMQKYVDAWPEGCIKTKYRDQDSGDYLYLDLKPAFGANMKLELYTDSICKDEYSGTSAKKLVQVENSMGYVTETDLQTWNMHLNKFKYCQPCITYSIDVESMYYMYGSEYNYGCTDDSGYTNVNQCMMFKSKANLLPATISDLQLADQQGGIVSITINGRSYGSSLQSSISETGEYQEHPFFSKTGRFDYEAYPILVVSILFFVMSILVFIGMIRWKQQRDKIRFRHLALQEPLVNNKSDFKKLDNLPRIS